MYKKKNEPDTFRSYYLHYSFKIRYGYVKLYYTAFYLPTLCIINKKKKIINRWIFLNEVRKYVPVY